MNEPESRPAEGRAAERERFAERVGRQEQRMLRARRRVRRNVWLGLGTLGLIGWSVATPPLIGAALGAWLDRGSADGGGWTVGLLAAGLALGCLNAWLWVQRERDEIVQDAEEDERDAKEQDGAG